MQLSERQKEIINIVKELGPITGEAIAQKINLTRAALRTDLTVLVMAGLIGARPRVGYYYVEKNTHSLLHDKLDGMKVKDYKSVPNVIREDITVYETIVALFIEDVGSLFVVSDGGILQGVVSRKDLLKVSLGQGDVHKIPVNVIMTRMPNIITTTMEESVLDAAKKIIEHEVDALPVVRMVEEPGANYGKLEVVGRFTKTNITKAFIELTERSGG